MTPASGLMLKVLQPALWSRVRMVMVDVESDVVVIGLWSGDLRRG